ncbi:MULTISPECIES: DUF523 and DUF1722 domain-containing protein [Gammaproteobacteria]|uniref:YbgA family protein n=1 Tax=Gammaproteobacteria TaxID=1236 RepID=UPI000DCF952C|nr:MULTISPECIES: DUF523 and DUF1722 domain-containing protein [Gammaproteobacteria]RTE87324.1 DUF1722 domain-containing protein [Aliidiomarina sp. B3213]TCZ92890.1 DUF1722 domain-containing protein [Lysobacter sp. N42]
MIKVGISSCLMGQKVRFDGGHKASLFCQQELSKYVQFQPLCPEVGIGLSVPRPSIRLEQHDEKGVRAFIPKTETDVTEQLQGFANQHQDKFTQLSGYVLCAKSPSCGMERVRVYKPGEKHNEKNGVGIFTQRLMELQPNLPIEEDGRLNDPFLRENFILRVFIYADWQGLTRPLTKKALLDFHTRHKLLLLAHNQPLYRQIGHELAQTHQITERFENEYISRVMEALSKPASRKNHTNVMQHVQGYFKNYLSEVEKEELAELILQYRKGIEPLSSPLTLLKHYQKIYPNDYLASQSYFNPYPQQLKLRYGL